MKGLLKSVACLGVFLSVMVTAVPFASAENAFPSLEAGVDRLSTQLMEAIANRYFDADKRPVIKLALFDFTDNDGDITVGSRYISNRIRLAFGSGPQFNLIPLKGIEEKGHVITDKVFTDNSELKSYIIGELKADVYIMGRIYSKGESTVACEVSLCGTAPPFNDLSKVIHLTREMVPPLSFDPEVWRLDLTSSGLRLFQGIEVAGAQHVESQIRREELGRVIFLTQPLCDDMSASWKIQDGIVYDTRKEKRTGSLADRAGQVMQSRIKSMDLLKGINYVIKEFTLALTGKTEVVNRLTPYVIGRDSRYFLVPLAGQEGGLRFTYLWDKPGKSKEPFSGPSGKGWQMYMAADDWKLTMPVGTHVCTATLIPMTETEYGSRKTKTEFVKRFKIQIDQGLNIYVINYAYRSDRPAISVRRLQFEGTRDNPIQAVKSITEVFDVYGEKKGAGQ